VHAVKDREVQLGDRGQLQHARGVDDDIDAAELGFDLVEGGGDRLLIGHVGTHGDRAAARGGDFADGGLRLGDVAGIDDRHGEAVGGQAPNDRPADAA
jgi:hypothetical protein